jgi:hypothetical protein
MLTDWEIIPNPDYEYVKLTVPSTIQPCQVVVDTVSVPEPSMSVLLCIGVIGLAVRGRLRRRKT